VPAYGAALADVRVRPPAPFYPTSVVAKERIMSTSIGRLLTAGLALSCPFAHAALLTVGPGGTHASIQQALSAATTIPGDDEIRIAAGVYDENITFFATLADTVTISGGWDAAFALRMANPALTVIDGGASGHGVYGSVSQGRVEIANLTVRNGESFTGGGMELDASGTAQLLLADLVLHDNLATWEFASNGGGLKLNARNDAVAEVRDSLIRDNRSISTGNSTVGGGAYLYASENGRILLQRCVFEDNTAQSPSQPRGGGMYVDAFNASSIEIRRSELRGNVLLGGSMSGGNGAALNGLAIGTATLQVRSTVFARNRDESRIDGGQQLSLQTANSATVRIGDAEISAGSGMGVEAFAYDTSRTDLTNLTVVANSGGGLLLNRFSGAVTSLFNSILHGNGGTELSTNQAPTSGANLIEGSSGATDPRFVDVALDDYRLRAGSPAIDAGSGAPPAGLGATDADGGVRLLGTAVDLGAYEFVDPTLFADGFEG
jgi:hypothetical protein